MLSKNILHTSSTALLCHCHLDYMSPLIWMTWRHAQTYTAASQSPLSYLTTGGMWTFLSNWRERRVHDPEWTHSRMLWLVGYSHCHILLQTDGFPLLLLLCAAIIFLMSFLLVFFYKVYRTWLFNAILDDCTNIK